MVTKDVYLNKVKDQLNIIDYQAKNQDEKLNNSRSNGKNTKINGMSLQSLVEEDKKQLLEMIDEIVSNRISNVDLKSYDFDKDPDCSYNFAIQQL